MTEEIIIDGVDVAGCEYHTPTCVSTHLWGALTKSTKCEENPNCYYKQLKRLEQENKELKKQLSSTKCYLCGEGFLTPEGAELYDEKEQYRSALEEINRTLLGVRGLSINCDRQIGKVKAIINEVLGEK